MSTFTFNTTPSLLCGPGTISQLGMRVRALGMSRVLVVTDAGIVKAGLLEPVLSVLRESDITVTVFDGVEADPAEWLVLKATELAIRSQVQGVIGLAAVPPWTWPNSWPCWPRACSG